MVQRCNPIVPIAVSPIAIAIANINSSINNQHISTHAINHNHKIGIFTLIYMRGGARARVAATAHDSNTTHDARPRISYLVQYLCTHIL